MSIMKQLVFEGLLMRYMIFLIVFVFAININAKEVKREAKIVLGTFDTIQRAQKKLEKLDSVLTDELREIQKKENFDILARPSGKKYIITVEPIQSIKRARQIRKILPKPFNKNSFVGNYSLPKRYETINKIKILEQNTTTQDVSESVEEIEIKEDVQVVGNDTNISSLATNTTETTKKSKTLIEEVEKIDTEQEAIIETVVETTTENLDKEEANKTALLSKKEDAEERSSSKKVKTQEQSLTTSTQKMSDVVPQKDYSQNDPQSVSTADKERIKEDILPSKTFGVKLLQATEEFFSILKKYTLEITTTLSSALVRYVFEIAILILLLSCVLLFFAYQKSIVLHRKIRWLKASRHEAAKDFEFLKTDMSNLKTYFNALVDSTHSPLRKLEEHFQSRNTKIEDKEAKDAVHLLAHSMRAYDNFGGNIILHQKELDLNALVKRVVSGAEVKLMNSNIKIDFDNPMLKKVVGDSQKISRVIASLVNFCCKSSKNGCRLLIVLNEIVQDAKGNIVIKIIIKNSKESFNSEAMEKIKQAFGKKGNIQKDSYDDDVLELIAVQRILEIMQGHVKALETYRGDSGFVFDMKLKIINRRAIQQNLFSHESFFKLNILIFGNNAESVRTVQSELEFLNLDTDTCFSWNQMLENFNDIYFLIDIVIVQNATLPFVDIKSLNKASRKKNFVTVVILEEYESESDELRQIERKKVLKRPYEKDTLPRVLNILGKEQKPTTLNS